MFTGIVRHVGIVRDVRSAGDGKRLGIDLGPLAEGLSPGESVAVAGACLTAAEISASNVIFDVVGETLSRTTLGELRAGAKVNLERSLRLGEALDGHLVQGHVDGTARVARVNRTGQWIVEFDAPAELTDMMVPKGSVAIDGVSLTLVNVADGRFSVALIPTTLGRTTAGKLAVGERVNVETDIIGKCVRRYLQQRGNTAGGVTMEKLREAGFI
ncbi:MAG: riboflavin synthase [Phycisphaerae bacterium]|nr:riboflavin synthase [Phycisphaerae bacterium]